MRVVEGNHPYRVRWGMRVVEGADPYRVRRNILIVAVATPQFSIQHFAAACLGVIQRNRICILFERRSSHDQY
jgi:hypothetical protein